MAARGPRRGWVLLVGLALAAASCQSSGGGTSEGGTADGGDGDGAKAKEKVFLDGDFGITFRYPGVLEPGVLTEEEVAGSSEPTARAVLALDEDNGILLSKYDLNVSVTGDNLQDVLPELEQLMGQLSPEAGSSEIVEIGTLPGVQYDDVTIEKPAEGKSQLLFLFDQRTEYLVNCQSTPKERAVINGACERVLATIQKK